ncbi:uncharacterized protein LOC108096131 [Drosophila ficusphila]|uniref:uncharacterized protein LOC108096131 n=1 Tax=Drosophila ficusphila TaxID=30025 RepID=UPI0007E6D24F|nr:uncharacterized protein LOC108096131 [Drosophila ficusphila]
MQGCWALSKDTTGRGPHSNAAEVQRQSRDPKSNSSYYTQIINGDFWSKNNVFAMSLNKDLIY